MLLYVALQKWAIDLGKHTSKAGSAGRTCSFMKRVTLTRSSSACGEGVKPADGAGAEQLLVDMHPAKYRNCISGPQISHGTCCTMRWNHSALCYLPRVIIDSVRLS